MEPILINLDRPRAIRWTHRADARLGSLERPVVLRDVVSKNPSRAFYALLCYVWAALVDRHEFAQPEDIAELLGTAEKQTEAFTNLHRALVEAGVLEGEKKTSEPVTGSTNGPSQSSNSAPVVPTTKT